MLFLAVLPEHLAVVADSGHDPPSGIPTRKAGEEASDLPVDVSDLPGVAASGGHALPVARREVRRVRIVVMHPEEVRAAGWEARRPAEGGARDEGGVPFRVSLLPGSLGDHEVVVDVEPPREAEAAIQNARRHERGGAIAAAGERFRERRDPRGKRGHSVVADAVGGGLETGQDRTVRRERQRRSRQRVPEADSALCEGIEVRGQRGAALNPTDVIRPRRIERDQNDGRRLNRGGGEPAEQEERGQADDYGLRPGPKKTGAA